MIKYIYESPDKGKTVYRREFGKPERVEVPITPIVEPPKSEVS